MGAGALVAVWALIADGPLGAFPRIGPRLHRRGLIVVGLAVGLTPFVAGRAADVAVLVPCVAAALGLLRVGIVVRPVEPEPVAAPPTPPVPVAPPSEPSLMRLAGRAAAVAQREGGARSAGRLAGRLTSRTKGKAG